MPRNRTSDDADQIPTDPASQNVTKKAVPKPAPIPDYEPLNIDDFTIGTSNLPPHVKSNQPYEIFSLFFPEEQLQKLADHINTYAKRVMEAEKAEKAEKPWSRSWIPTTMKELRAYIGVYIYMGLDGGGPIKVFWNTDLVRSIYHAVRNAIGLNRWQQIDRFFHISNGYEQSVFD